MHISQHCLITISAYLSAFAQPLLLHGVRPTSPNSIPYFWTIATVFQALKGKSSEWTYFHGLIILIYGDFENTTTSHLLGKMTHSQSILHVTFPLCMQVNLWTMHAINSKKFTHNHLHIISKMKATMAVIP